MTTEALPKQLVEASEVEALESLSRLMASGKIKPSRVRSLLVSYKVARSKQTDGQPYETFEMVRRGLPSKP